MEIGALEIKQKERKTVGNNLSPKDAMLTNYRQNVMSSCNAALIKQMKIKNNNLKKKTGIWIGRKVYLQ